MKIAIIGNGQTAIESTLFFLNLDCTVSLFGGNYFLKTDDFFKSSQSAYQLSSLGQKILEIENTELNSTEYREKYILPISNKLREIGVLRDCEVARVTKAHLASDELVSDRSRLCDLFRVTFQMNAEKMVEEQIKLNEMAFNNISADALNSLKRSIEMAEDYDLVLLANDIWENNRPIGVGENFSLNELIFNQENQFINNDYFDPQEIYGDVAILGEANKISSVLKNIQENCESEKIKKIFLINSNTNFFEKLGNTQSNVVNQYIKDLKKDLELFYQDEKKRLELELIKWNALEDYERVKFPKPQMIEPVLISLEGMTVISVDRLDESKKFFMTIEPTKNPSQYEEFLGVRTIGVDWIINANLSHVNQNIYNGLNISSNEIKSEMVLLKNEPGFFHIFRGNQIGCTLSETQKKLEIIFTEINKYFSKKGE